MEKITFDINNLFAKKEVLISKDEIVEIVHFAIQNGIVKVETQTMDVEADENYILLENKVLRLGYEDTVENVLIKPFDYKDEVECSSCNDTGEIEVPRGSSSHFVDCHCKKE